MKANIMMALLGLLAAAPAVAQQKAKSKPKEEVIIQKKGDGNEKTTIIIDGDRITVNGKALAEYNGDDIIIRKKELNSMIEREMREHQRELSYAQRDFKRAQDEMNRAMIEMRVSPRIYRYSPDHFDYEYNFNHNNDLKMKVKSEPRAFLGVGLETADKGVKITEVSEGSAAAKAGLKAGDKITKFGTAAVASPEQLTELVSARKPNEEVEITYFKTGEKKERKVKVKLGQTASNRIYYRDGDTPPTPPRAPKAPRPPREDMIWEMPMTPMPPMPPMAPMDGFRWNYSSRQELGIRIQDMDDSAGVKVLDVSEGSLAATAGVKENDVITSINGKTIKDTDDARMALRDTEDKYNYSLKILRGGSAMNLEIKVPKKLKKADL